VVGKSLYHGVRYVSAEGRRIHRGIRRLAGSIGGMLFATSAGLLLEWTGSYMTMFIAAGVAYLLAMLIIHLLVPKLEPAKL
jgi:ACS family hexuronate transporter-like MFS transporter